MWNKNAKKRHWVQMIQVKNSLILDDRFYLPLQIFLNQEKNLYYL
jgi:hypothetical protein